MKVMAVVVGIIGIVSVLGGHAAKPAPASRNVQTYPRICGIEGKPEILLNGKPGTKFEDRRLTEALLIRTRPTDRVCLDVEAGLRISVFSDSDIAVPAIDWQTGRVEEVLLNEGKILFKRESPAQGLRINSALYRDTPPEGEYVFEFLPDDARIRATVLKGTLPFRGLETEASSKLMAGETQAFLGEQNEGKIQYDILLHGKKVARGQLGAKTKLPEADLKRLAAFFHFKEKKKPRPKTEEELARAAGPPPSGKPTLCIKPNGGFNDCLYRCENNPNGKKICDLSAPGVRCLRMRCLADGTWSDPLEFSKAAAPCEARDTVRACEY